jgi:diguanylate cyclase (GGDEF)-like protein/PAS domain S-box-containing protein
MSHHPFRRSAAVARRAGQSVFTAWAVLLVSLIATYLTWESNVAGGEKVRRTRFDQQAAATIDAVKGRMQDYEQVLRGAAGLFAVNESVDRIAWREYVRSLRLDEAYPGIQAIGFVRYVSGTERERHIAAVRGEGFPSYTIRPEGARTEFTSVVYIEPFSGRNLRAFGYDMFAEPTRRAAMERARDTGETALSGRVTLVQDMDQNKQAGVVMYLPIYQSGLPLSTTAERRAALLGWVYSPFRMNDLMRGTLGSKPGPIGVEIFDGQVVQANALLYDDDGTPNAQSGMPSGNGLAQVGKVALGGTIWTLHMHTRAQFDERHEARQPSLIIGAGVAISVLLFLVFLGMARQRARAISIARTITEHLQRSEERYRMVVDNVREVIFQIDAAGKWTFLNPAWRDLTGFEVDEALGRSCLDAVHAEDRDSLAESLRTLSGEGHKMVRQQIRIGTKPGESRWVEIHLRPMIDDDGRGTGALGTLTDVTERRSSEERIRHLAQHDALTGLPNRTLLADRIGSALLHAERAQSQVAILWIDLDKFKSINDTLGHAVGDQLLQAVAKRLVATLRKSDTVARVGGDEFVVVLPGLRNTNDAALVARNVLAACSKVFPVAGNDLLIGASIGISVFPDDGRDRETLLSNADKAMYQVKESGRNGVQFFTAQMNAAAERRLALETELRAALERREFVLHYQPQIDLATRRLTGMEALVRWQHPTRGIVLPGEFIGLAEDTGLIVPIGQWVLREACERCKAWQESNGPRVRVAVNLSARQFYQKDLVATVVAVLSETRLAPEFLELEITERAVAQHPERARETLNQLKVIGVRVAIDDFGTGLSSVSTLMRLPVDRLKIDRSFVHGLSVEPEDAAIATAVIHLAHSLGKCVVAEGVETAHEMEFLRAHACDEGQGLLFSKPVTGVDVPTLWKALGAESGASEIQPIRARPKAVA